jgi:hypothetical protein
MKMVYLDSGGINRCKFVGAVFDRPGYNAPISGVYRRCRLCCGIPVDDPAGDRRSPLRAYDGIFVQSSGERPQVARTGL